MQKPRKIVRMQIAYGQGVETKQQRALKVLVAMLGAAKTRAKQSLSSGK